MHILSFELHIAVLDPLTGLGVLVLPPPDPSADGWNLEDRAQATQQTVQRWFGHDTREYSRILGQLTSVGWELPIDNQGSYAWFMAGKTACCGRTMVSLTGLDVENTSWSVQRLIDVSQRMQEAASVACCGQSAVRSSPSRHRWPVHSDQSPGTPGSASQP